jgi:uncharacterized protein
VSVVRHVCRTCGKPVVADDEKPLPEGFPFCSRRCRLIDLGKWADEEFKIAGGPLPHPKDDGDDAGR